MNNIWQTKQYCVFICSLVTLIMMLAQSPALSQIAVGARESIYTVSQRTARGLNWFPDGNLGVITNGNGSYQIYGANGSSSALISGPLTNPAQQGVVGVTIYGGTNNFPYQSGGEVYVDPDTGRRLLFYHAEIHPNGDYVHFYAELGVAISDPGSTTSFFDCGVFLQPNMTLPQAVAKTQAVEVCGAPYTICGNNFRVYFADTLTDGTRIGLTAAQAPISNVIAAAINHTTTVWQKYYNGSFSQPGLGGVSSPMETGNPSDSWMDVAWNSYINQYVATVVKWVSPSNTYLNLIFSLDGTNWSTRTQIETDAAESFYPTMIGIGSDPKNLGQSFYIYYTYSIAGAFDRWSDAVLSRRLITLPAFSIQNGCVQSNHFGFTITGFTNASLVVQGCTNLLTTWITLTNITLTGGAASFTDTNSTANVPCRFYRLRLP